MKKKRLILPVMAMSMLLVACTAQGENTKENEAIKHQEEVKNDPKENTQQVKIETKVLAKEEELLFLDISYPILSGMNNTKKQDELNAYFFEFAKTIEQQTHKDEEALVEAGVEDIHAGGSLRAVEMLINEQLVSLDLIGYQYGGGANGTPFHFPFVYDLKQDKQLALADLFEKEVLPQEALLTFVNDAMKNSEYGDLVFEPITEIAPDQPFYLTKDEVVFTFDKYEYTAGAAGAPEVKIAKEKLTSLKADYR